MVVCVCVFFGGLTHLGLKPGEFVMFVFRLCCFICLSFACGSVLLHMFLNLLFVIVVLIHVVSSVLLLNCLVCVLFAVLP